MIWWTFEAILKSAEKSGHPKEKVIVSTDDLRILDLATRLGFTARGRPAHLAGPQTTMLDVLAHHVPDFGSVEKSICVLYPTSPFRSAYDIQQARHQWNMNGSLDRSLMSVSPVLHRPYGLMGMDGEGFLACLNKRGEEFYQAQHQPFLYRANGAIYILPVEQIKNRTLNTQLFCEKTIPYVMSESAGFEIDTEHDFLVAEALMRERSPSPSSHSAPHEAHAALTGG